MALLIICLLLLLIGAVFLYYEHRADNLTSLGMLYPWGLLFIITGLILLIRLL